MTKVGVLFREFKRKGFALDVLKLAGGTTTAQVITVLSLPILSRLYPPDAFGTAGLFTSLVTVVAVVACLRYEFAIMLPADDQDAVNVFGIAFVSSLVFGLLSAAIVVAAGDAIVNRLNAPALRAYLWLLPIALTLAGMYQALSFWNSRRKQFGRVSAALVMASAASSGTQLGAGLAGQTTAGGLIVGGTMGTVVATGALAAQIWRSPDRLLLRAVRPRRLWQNLVRFRKFPLVDSWGGFINNLAWQLPVLLLSVYFNQSVVGLYAMAFRTIQLPMALVGNSIGQVFFQRASAVRHDTAALSSVVLSVFDRLVALMMIPAILLTLVGQDFFVVILGKEWAEAGRYVQILGVWTIVWFISSPLSTMFSVLERQGSAVAVHVAILLSRAAALIIGWRAQSIDLTLLLFTGSGIAIYGGMLVWIMRLSGVSLRAVLGVLLRYGRYGALLAITLLAIKALGGEYSALILIASVASAAVCFFWMLRGSVRGAALYSR